MDVDWYHQISRFNEGNNRELLECKNRNITAAIKPIDRKPAKPANPTEINRRKIRNKIKTIPEKRRMSLFSIKLIIIFQPIYPQFITLYSWPPIIHLIYYNAIQQSTRKAVNRIYNIKQHFNQFLFHIFYLSVCSILNIILSQGSSLHSLVYSFSSTTTHRIYGASFDSILAIVLMILIFGFASSSMLEIESIWICLLLFLSSRKMLHHFLILLVLVLVSFIALTVLKNLLPLLSLPLF